MKTLIETTPALEPTPQAIANPIEELRECHAIDSPLFQQREQCGGAKNYLHGLPLEIPAMTKCPVGGGALIV